MPPVKDEEVFDPIALLNKKKDTGYVCTVVTLLPYEITEEKPHLFPGVFDLPAAPKDGFSLFYVGESVHFIPDAFDEKRNYRQLTPPYEMARSICEDYNCAHIGLTPNAGPGLFYLHDRLSKQQILDNKESKTLLEFYRERQKRWFHNLVAMADADWEKNHNRMAVSDLQRIAAQSLGVVKDWVSIAIQEQMSCPFCRVMIAVDSVKCANCKEVVNVEAYNKLVANVQK